MQYVKFYVEIIFDSNICKIHHCEERKQHHIKNHNEIRRHKSNNRRSTRRNGKRKSLGDAARGEGEPDNNFKVKFSVLKLPDERHPPSHYTHPTLRRNRLSQFPVMEYARAPLTNLPPSSSRWLRITATLYFIFLSRSRGRDNQVRVPWERLHLTFMKNIPLRRKKITREICQPRCDVCAATR